MYLTITSHPEAASDARVAPVAAFARTGSDVCPQHGCQQLGADVTNVSRAMPSRPHHLEENSADQVSDGSSRPRLPNGNRGLVVYPPHPLTHHRTNRHTITQGGDPTC